MPVYAAADECWEHIKYTPQKDITAWELSQVLIIYNHRFYYDTQLDEKWKYVQEYPKNVKRHFTLIKCKDECKTSCETTCKAVCKKVKK